MICDVDDLKKKERFGFREFILFTLFEYIHITIYDSHSVTAAVSTHTINLDQLNYIYTKHKLDSQQFVLATIFLPASQPARFTYRDSILNLQAILYAHKHSLKHNNM